MPDVGFTHVALPVTNMDASVGFYRDYAGMEVVHRRARHSDDRREVAWLSDRKRPFVLVLAETGPVDHPLGPFAHLGVACATHDDVDRLAARARAAGCLRDGPRDMGPPVGYIANITDPDGHTVELSFGQDVAFAATT